MRENADGVSYHTPELPEQGQGLVSQLYSQGGLRNIVESRTIFAPHPPTFYQIYHPCCLMPKHDLFSEEEQLNRMDVQTSRYFCIPLHLSPFLPFTAFLAQM